MFWRKPGILIPDVYFYYVKIQINFKQNLVEKYAEELQIFKNIFFGTRPTHFGLGRTMNSGALSTVHAEQWRQCSEEEEEDGRRADLRWLRGCAASGCWPENGLDGGRLFFFLFAFFFFCFVLLYFGFFSVSSFVSHGTRAVINDGEDGGSWRWRWWRLCLQQPVVPPPFSPYLFSLPRLGNGVGGAAVALLVRVKAHASSSCSRVLQ